MQEQWWIGYSVGMYIVSVGTIKRASTMNHEQAAGAAAVSSNITKINRLRFFVVVVECIDSDPVAVSRATSAATSA